jgi:cation transport ATPase
MLQQWFLQRQLRELRERTGIEIRSLAELKKLAELKQVIFPTSLLFYTGAPIVRQFFAVQDQTLATKQHVLQIARGLVEHSTHPILQAIAQAGEEAGLAPREIETDEIADIGVVGKLDRTWYVLGDESTMATEQIELGVTIQTLAHQFEIDGKYTIFLAQKQPKRLLGIFACEYEIKDGVAEAIQELRVAGVESVLLTSVKTRIARGLGNRLSISLIHSEINDRDKQRIANSLINQQPDSAFVEPANAQIFSVSRTLRVAVGEGGDEKGICIPTLPDLITIIVESRRILEKARRTLFWSKI